MADFIQPTNLNSELISAGLNPNDPANTYVDFINSLANARNQQALQEQQVAQAVQMAKQSGIKTAQEEEAQGAGYNPILSDTMTPEEAETYLRIVLKEKGLQADDDLIEQWVKQLPPRVNRQIVESFANRFARETTRTGQAFVATDADAASDKTDENGDKLVAGQTYAALYDNQGNIQAYIRSGQERPDQSGKLALKESESTEKQWQKLDNSINTFIKSQRGNQLTQALVRADRALNELANGITLTPQVLSYIEKDISGIFQGGVPPVSGMDAEDFTTIYQRINQFIQKYTGVSGYFKTDLGNQRDYLLGLLSRLRESTDDMLKSMISSEVSAYKTIIDADPDRWTKMFNDKVAALEGSLSPTAKAATGALATPPGVQTIPGATATNAAIAAKRVVPKYTVEE